MPIWLSAQSMNEKVLKEIKRENIDIRDMISIQKKLQEQNIPSKSELIMCLPYETFETHVESLIQLVKLEIDQIVCYQLMLIQGSELKSDKEGFKKHLFSTKFRVLARNFSDIEGVGRSLEIEEIVTATKDFSFEDYLNARKLHLLLCVYYNGKAFKGFFKYLIEYKLNVEKFLLNLLDHFAANPEMKKILECFISETKEELFENEEKLRRYYTEDKNFKKLLTGAAGANLLQKYTSRLYMEKNHFLID